MATNNALNNSSATGFTVSSGNISATTGTISTGASSITSATTLTASSGNITATLGDIAITSGNITLPVTSSSTVGVITKNTLGGAGGVHTFLHTYYDSVGGNSYNIFLGWNAGNFTLSGARFNTGIGGGNLAGNQGVLHAITSGQENTCVGYMSGGALTSGESNTSLGSNSLSACLTGKGNLALGGVYGVNGAGSAYTGSESSNICLNAQGTAGESHILRIGDGAGTSAGQLAKAFIHGIRGITTDAADAVAVLISSTGQLGTTSSSRRYKENIKDMGDASSSILKLRPVTFNLISDNKKRELTGLIAEEVAEVMPNLVSHDLKGEIETVKYHELPTLILNELQKLNKRIVALEAQIGKDE